MTLNRLALSTALLCAAALTCLAPAARAELDKASQEALEKTQALLRDPNQRNAAIKDNKDAQRNHESLESLLGAGNTNGVYDISAEVFEKLVKESNGDPVVMQQKLQEAQKNPEAFAKKYFNSSQQARIKQMAEQAGGAGAGNDRKP